MLCRIKLRLNKACCYAYLLFVFLSFSSKQSIHHLEEQQHDAKNGYPVYDVIEAVCKKPYRHKSVDKKHNPS